MRLENQAYLPLVSRKAEENNETLTANRRLDTNIKEEKGEQEGKVLLKGVLRP